MRLAEGERPRGATLLERTVAYAADSVVTLGLWFLLVFALTGGSIGQVTEDPTRGVIATFLFLLIPFTYFVAAEWIASTTPGKRLVGLEVRDDEGRPASLFAVTVRNVLRLPWALGPLGPLILAVDAGFVQRTERDQRIGDLAAGTRVLRIGPAPLGF